GTGSLGKVLTRWLLARPDDRPGKIRIFSRDEAKQHFMRLEYLHKTKATDEVIYHDFERLVEFRIGDVRDYHAVCSAMDGADIVVNAAALKQVPSCEYFPFEAVQTNVVGAENIVRAVRDGRVEVGTVVGVSTDKACKAVNVMGMTKALQERIFVGANLTVPATRFICVRYGNVLASRGSVIPLFHEQIRNGGPVTITTDGMTRFLLSLGTAVELIAAAIARARAGETYVPKIPAARIVDVANALIGRRTIEIVRTGIRPGEKIHEILVSEEEAARTVDLGDYYAIQPIQPELQAESVSGPRLEKEYSSADSLMTPDEIRTLLERHSLMPEQGAREEGEFLR
ncbi:MAG: polysaccharide biosynthesis protein, partial [Acidobacteria bacterium]